MKPKHTPTKEEIAEYLNELIENTSMIKKEKAIMHHIAKTINSHDELVEALKQMAHDYAISAQDEGGELPPNCKKILNKAKQALAKTKERGIYDL